MLDRNTSFDLHVRSVLKDAEEAVSPHVWEGVSRHLDRLDARRRALRWWRRAGVAVAAAAAVALGVFFASHRDNSNQPTILTNNHQVAVAERPAGTTLPDRDAATPTQAEEAGIPAGTARIADIPAPARRSVRQAGDRVPAELPPVETASFDEPETAVELPVSQPDETPVTTAGPTTAVPSGAKPAELPKKEEYRAEDEAALRALMQEDATRRSHGSALSFGGELQTNGHPSASFRGMRRAQTTPTTGIEELSSQSVYAAPVSFGLGFRYDLSERWSVGTGLTLSILGRTFNGVYSQVDGTLNTVQSTSSEIRNTQYYLGIPVNVYFNIVNNPNLRLYTYAGGSFEKNLLNRYTISAMNNLVYREPVSGIQISAGFGLGVEFMLSRNVGIYVDPSVRYYFNCYQPKSIRTQQPLMLNLEAGLRFNLGR